MLELLSLIVLLLTPLWGYLLWRRMKYVQDTVNKQRREDKRHHVVATEDVMKSEADIKFSKSLSFDDNLAEAEQKANERSIIKDLEGRKH